MLADDLLDKVGHVLLPVGTSLTEKMLQAISHHDIQQLSVVVEALSEDELELQKQQKLARVNHLFRLTGDSPPASTLKQYICDYRSKESS